jgi:prevent-host-death family protein
MIKIGLREANLHFSRYLKMVKDGKEVVLTDRGKPVAFIKPVHEEERSEEERIRYLEDQGILKQAVQGRFPLHMLITISGKPVSKIVVEGRKDRL